MVVSFQFWTGQRRIFTVASAGFWKAQGRIFKSSQGRIFKSSQRRTLESSQGRIFKSSQERPFKSSQGIFKSYALKDWNGHLKDSRGYGTSPGVAGKVVFSGIQPTGELHLGNYYGAIEKWVQLQSSNDVNRLYISVVDLHAITVPNEGLTSDLLRQRVYSTTAGLLASGLDPGKCTIFQQSHLPQHCEMTWILACLTATMARLNRLGQYKERSSKYTDGNVPLGLFIYPVLQAADILLYRSTHVPVGDDQQQHLMIARHFAEVFNNRYQESIFPIPERISTGFTRVRSLREPGKKMSKSDVDQRSRINLNDDPSVIRDKFKKALTDMESRVTYDPEKRPAVANLINIHSMVTGKRYDEICAEVAGLTTGQYKLVVAECVLDKFGEYRERYRRYLEEKAYLDQVLREGAAKAAVEATKTLEGVRKLVGFD